LLVSCRPPMIAVNDKAQRDAINSASAFSVPKPHHYVPLASFFPFLIPSSPSPAATGLFGRPRFRRRRVPGRRGRPPAGLKVHARTASHLYGFTATIHVHRVRSLGGFHCANSRGFYIIGCLANAVAVFRTRRGCARC